MPIINLEKIRHSYGSGENAVEVLKGVDLQVNAGDMVSIRGPSGSGKSTLLSIMGCLLTPQSGTYSIAGYNVGKSSPDEVTHIRGREIGFIFQQFHLVPRASVLENILLPTKFLALSSGEKKEVYDRAIALGNRLGLGDRLHHLPNELSGGQQQRVAIARSLINKPKIILADEPTGNLDEANSAEIMSILKELHKDGQTIIIITHDPDIAAQCERNINMRDGVILEPEEKKEITASDADEVVPTFPKPSILSVLPLLLAQTWFDLKRNKMRSLLTMLGVTIGIASVLAMTTLGDFAKTKILSGYEAMGVNKLVMQGWPNWRLEATEEVPATFRQFHIENDIKPIKRIFPEVRYVSPVMNAWEKKATFAGREQSASIVGVGPDYFAISNRELLLGKSFGRTQTDFKHGVCVLGYKVAKELFDYRNPLGKIINIADSGDSSFNCRIIGVMKSQQSNKEWVKPDEQILLPYTYLQNFVNNWEARIRDVAMKVEEGANVSDTGLKIKAYLHQKYGASGHFSVNADDVMVAQVKRFLNIFAVLLAVISLVSLLVGGIGIANMMLVSVTERYREIGLRKALGAPERVIKMQFLLEAVVLCCIAGIIGLCLGFTIYEAVIYGAARFIDGMEFVWILEPAPFVFSFLCIFVVGVASGIIPAIRAQNMEIVEALRRE